MTTPTISKALPFDAAPGGAFPQIMPAPYRIIYDTTVTPTAPAIGIGNLYPAWTTVVSVANAFQGPCEIYIRNGSNVPAGSYTMPTTWYLSTDRHGTSFPSGVYFNNSPIALTSECNAPIVFFQSTSGSTFTLSNPQMLISGCLIEMGTNGNLINGTSGGTLRLDNAVITSSGQTLMTGTSNTVIALEQTVIQSNLLPATMTIDYDSLSSVNSQNGNTGIALAVLPATFQTFVFRPGGISGGNVYTNETLLAAATQELNGADYTIFFDLSLDGYIYTFTTTGALNFASGGTWTDNQLNYVVKFVNNTTLTNLPTPAGTLTIVLNQSVAVFTANIGTVPAFSIRDRAQLSAFPSSTAPFISGTNYALEVFAYGHASLFNDSNTTPLFIVNGIDGVGLIFLFDGASAGGDGSIPVIGGTSTANNLRIYPTAPDSVSPANFPHLVVTNIYCSSQSSALTNIPVPNNFASPYAYLSVLGVLYVSNNSTWVLVVATDAATTSYEPTTPGNWTTPPTEVAQALDELATYPYTPATPGNWAVPPTKIQTALDDLAASASPPEQPVFIFDTTVTPHGNVYNNFTTLCAAVAAYPDQAIIYFQNTPTIPSGTYNFGAFVIFQIEAQDLLNIEDNVIFTHMPLAVSSSIDTRTSGPGISAVTPLSALITGTFNSQSPFTIPVDGNLSFSSISFFTSGTAGVIHVEDTGTVALLSCTLAPQDANYPIQMGTGCNLLLDSTHSTELLVSMNDGTITAINGSEILVNTVQDVSGFAPEPTYVDVLSADQVHAAQSAVFGGLLDIVLLNSANALLYSPTNSNQWYGTPVTVQEALDELAVVASSIPFITFLPGGAASPPGVFADPVALTNYQGNVSVNIWTVYCDFIYVGDDYTQTEDLVFAPNTQIVGVIDTIFQQEWDTSGFTLGGNIISFENMILVSSVVTPFVVIESQQQVVLTYTTISSSDGTPFFQTGGGGNTFVLYMYDLSVIGNGSAVTIEVQATDQCIIYAFDGAIISANSLQIDAPTSSSFVRIYVYSPNVRIDSSLIGMTGVQIIWYAPRSGTTTLVNGISPAIVAYVAANSCIVATHANVNASAAIGTLIAKTSDRTNGEPGSFKITSISAANATVTGDQSTINWTVSTDLT